jgi:hypothetical protein
MKNEKKDKLFEEGLRKFKYRVGYKINESPRYRSLIGTNEEFDEVPVLTKEAGDQEDAEKPGGGEQPPAPSNDQPLGMTEPKPPATGGEQPPEEMPPAEGQPSTGGGTMPPVDTADPNGMGIDPIGMGAPEQQVDDIQNDIIKHNIAAMQSIHDKLEGLDANVQGLNAKLDALNADVEEVREPTNSEKLMSKTNVSYPYYFNLNDFWSGNWFNEKRKAEHEKGVRELPDGSFIADFDDLPQKSKQDVQNSFNEFS